MLLDTTVLIDLLRKNQRAIEKVSELETHGIYLTTTTISVFEIVQGIRKDNSEDQEEKISSILSRVNVFSLDLKAAIEAGKISQELQRKGTPISPPDCMIAGIAKIQNETILTRNQKHFSKIAGVQVQTY